VTVRSTRPVKPVSPKVDYGAGAPGHQGDSFVKTLAYKVQGSRVGEFSYSCSGTRVPYLCIPVSFGTPVFRIAACLLPGGVSLVWTGDITDADTGVTSSYALWAGDKGGLGVFSIKVN